MSGNIRNEPEVPGIDMNDVEVAEESEHQLSEAQIFGINSTVIVLLSRLKQYAMLTAVQMELTKKSHQIQPIMREIYQYEEMKNVTLIRESFDMFYVYASHDKIVIKNVGIIREKFEQAMMYVTSNMQKVESVMDKNYLEVLDSFADMITMIIKHASVKPIFSEDFKIG